MWCVVPAAGEGTRMEPVARRRPKALVEVGGRTLLARLLEGLGDAVRGVFVVVPPRDDGGRALRRALKSLDATVPFRLEAVTQERRHGVADAVSVCGPRLAGEPFAVVMGDAYYERPLAPYLRALAEAGPPAVLVEPARGPSKEAAGVVRLEEGRVTAIGKRPLEASDRFRVAGAFAFPPGGLTAFERARPRGDGADGEFELERVVRTLLDEGTVVCAVRYDGWRRNVNTPADLEAVRRRAGASPG